MSIIGDYGKKVKTLQKELNEAVLTDLCVNILKFPDNPAKIKISENPKSFKVSVNSLDTGLQLSPFHNDFQSQYDFICSKIKMLSPESIESFLDQIIRTGSFRTANENKTFHTDVRKYLQTLFD